MFEFKFEVNEADLSDTESPFKKAKVEEKPISNSTAENIDWYKAEQIRPTVLPNFDVYELNAKELTIGNIELRHIVAGFLLEDIKYNDNDSRDIKKSEESHSDLIPGVYEGGAKFWECTDDLLTYLSDNSEKLSWENKRVLDLGCGSGLLGIYAMKCAAKVDFQDYNKDVIEKITIPNVLLNLKETAEEEEKIELLKEQCRFYSGDWSHFTQLTESLDKYDIILTSETIYNTENQEKLLETFRKRLKSDGTVLVAGKSHYFGVGGGLDQFTEYVKNEKDFECSYVWNADDNLKRGIIELKLK